MKEKHKLNIFPEMLTDDYTRLLKDLQENGFDPKQPIYLYQDAIIDGWHREKACNELNITPIYEKFIGSDIEAFEYCMRTNNRRDMTSSQWACIAAEAKGVYQMIKEAAAERKKASIPEKGQKGFQASVPQLIGEHKNKHDTETDAVVAKAYNTNRAYVDGAIKIKESNPEKFEEVKSGKKTITEAMREDKKENLVVPPPLEGRYRVFYADPPWKYNDALEISKDGVTESYGPADAHYPQMTAGELCLLPIKDMSEENAVLFLWTTSPLLEDAFKIIKAWGFKYKTSFVWDKVKHNMGHYNSVRHEFLLVCTKGSCTPDNIKLFDSVQTIERTDKHSEKPEIFREIIDTLYVKRKKEKFIELFNRKKMPAGWIGWGNESI